MNISKKNKNQRYEREFKVYNDMFWIVYHIYKRPHNFRKILIVCSTYIMSHSSKVSWGYRVSQTYIWRLLSDFTKKEKRTNIFAYFPMSTLSITISELPTMWGYVYLNVLLIEYTQTYHIIASHYVRIWITKRILKNEIEYTHLFHIIATH